MWLEFQMRCFTMVCLLALFSCTPRFQSESGIVPDERFGRVRNGSAYDKASVDVSAYGNLVRPADATIKRGSELGGGSLTHPINLRSKYWYGPVSPASGWDAIPDYPDTELMLHLGKHRQNRFSNACA